MTDRSDISDSSEEWEKVTAEWVGKEDLWQHTQSRTLFSTDAGKTFYDVFEDVDQDGNPHIYTSRSNTRG